MDQEIKEMTRRLEKQETKLKLEREKRQAADAALRKNRDVLKRVMKEMPD